MNHLDEMARTGWTAMDVSLFSRTGALFKAGSAWDFAKTRCQSFENRIQPLDGFFRATDHHAIAAFNTPDSATGAHIDIMDAFFFEHGSTMNVILEHRITAVDDCVASLH